MWKTTVQREFYENYGTRIRAVASDYSSEKFVLRVDILKILKSQGRELKIFICSSVVKFELQSLMLLGVTYAADVGFDPVLLFHFGAFKFEAYFKNSS